MQATPTPGGDSRRAATTDDEIRFHPWWEAELALRGRIPGDAYVERFWLPVMGPAATLCLRRIAHDLHRHPQGFTVAVHDLARSLGLGRGRGRNAPVARAIDRLCHFGLARRTPDAVMVRTHVPMLPSHLARRLPRSLGEEHDLIVDAGQSQPIGTDSKDPAGATTAARTGRPARAEERRTATRPPVREV